MNPKLVRQSALPQSHMHSKMLIWASITTSHTAPFAMVQVAQVYPQTLVGVC
jgi:hypothetical protein